MKERNIKEGIDIKEQEPNDKKTGLTSTMTVSIIDHILDCAISQKARKYIFRVFFRHFSAFFEFFCSRSLGWHMGTSFPVSRGISGLGVLNPCNWSGISKPMVCRTYGLHAGGLSRKGQKSQKRRRQLQTRS